MVDNKEEEPRPRTVTMPKRPEWLHEPPSRRQTVSGGHSGDVPEDMKR
jgi:hypothetical protein